MINDKLLKAKVQIILNHPFFATLMLSMRFSETETLTKTACTDGKDVYFNPSFIDEITIDEIKGVTAHEVLHVAFGHHYRQGERQLEKWNMACDYAINPILIASGFQLPKGHLISKAYENKSAEEIYSLLPDSKGDKGKNNQQSNGSGNGNSNSQPQPDPGGCGSVKQPAVKSKSELKQIEAENKQTVAAAAMMAKQQGKLPAHLQRLIDEMMEPVVDWRTVLSAFLTDITRNDYSFSKPNRRFIGQGLYLPSMESIDKGKFVLMVDTSGSIDKKQLNEFASEIQSILSESANHITVIYVDAKVHAPQEFEPDDILDLDAKGGGGTSFVPGYKYMEENDIEAKAVIYFTDGFCDDYPVTDIPTIWAICGGLKEFNPPFGDVVHLQ